MSITKFVLFSTLLFFGLFACQSGQHEITDKPADLLSRSQMALILSDIHIAEAEVSTTALAGDSLLMAHLENYQLIFEKHSCNEKQFKDSYHYYLSKPAELDSVYQDVIARLTDLEATHQPGLTQPEFTNSDSAQVSVEPIIKN